MFIQVTKYLSFIAILKIYQVGVFGMDVSGIAAQQAIFQMKMGTEMLKSASKAQQQVVEMVAATVDSQRGQNLNITV